MFLDNLIFTPPPDLKISDWSDANRILPPEASSEPGHWNTNRAPYQREMLDASCDPGTERVIMMTAAQIGKTEIILNTIGYYIDKEPSPILLIQPTLEMGESFSKDRLSTMLRDCPCLHGKVKDPRTRDSGNTLLHKTFPGGHITIAGANSPASLASRPIRILLCDEVDRYPVSAGTEGDPLTLAMKRTQNFWNRKIIIVSTPTMSGTSRIEKEYASSTREEWTLPCPNCGEFNPLDWERIIYEDRTEPVMKCLKCGHEFSGSEWKSSAQNGKWIAASPGNIRGFHVNALASPWVSWPEIVRQYTEAYANGPETLKVWRNTVLGLPYEETFGTLEVDGVLKRRETYGAELPEGVLLLTAGVDTQDNRLEVEIVGHGLRNETWGIYYRIIYGDPGGSVIWEELEELLSREWSFADGTTLGIACACIDAGGHYTDEVYKFCKGKARRNIYPILGRGTFGHPAVSRPSMKQRGKVYLFKLGVNTLKGELYTRLQAELGSSGYCHFPDDEKRGYDRVYFSGLLSERMIIRRKAGRDYVSWELKHEHLRNEPLDCRVYAMGAFRILNPDMKRHERNKETPPAMKPSNKPPKPAKQRILCRGMRL